MKNFFIAFLVGASILFVINFATADNQRAGRPGNIASCSDTSSPQFKCCYDTLWVGGSSQWVSTSVSDCSGGIPASCSCDSNSLVFGSGSSTTPDQSINAYCNNTV